MSNCLEDLTIIIPAKFGSNWPSIFREDYKFPPIRNKSCPRQLLFSRKDKTRNSLGPLKLTSLAKLHFVYEEFINKGASMHMNLQQISCSYTK